MKINPPKAIIDEKEPFKHTLFGRKEFADSLTGILRNVSENLVIFVNAPWGEGKTTFSQMWRADLKLQKLEVIYFDAYAADYFDDPFVSFSGEILELVDKRLAEGKKLVERREFKKTAVEVGKRLAGLAAKVGLRAATLGAVESAHLEELKEIGSEIASGVSEIGADVIEKKIENYAGEKDALKGFKESLAKLAAKFREEQLTHEFLIAMLSILKVKNLAVYQLLSTGSISVEHFFRETRLDNIKEERNQGVSQEWVKDMLDFCLMSDTEYANATKSEDGSNEGRGRLRNMGQWLIRYDMSRTKVIPFFCSRLDRFSLQPQ